MGDLEMKNATCLFRKFPHSESYWTSLFAVLLRYLSAIGENRRIPLWHYSEDGPKWRYSESGEQLDCAGLGFGNLFVERDLGEFLTGRKNSLKPDLLLSRPSGDVIVIENKTIGSRIGNQIETYRTVLRRSGVKHKILLLVSLGYENDSDWKAAHQKGEGLPPLILWEQILGILSDDRLPFAKLFDFDLRQYCEMKLEGRR